MAIDLRQVKVQSLSTNNATIAVGDDLETVIGKAQGQITANGSTILSGVAATAKTSFNPSILPAASAGTISYSDTTGELTMTPASSTFAAGVSAVEMEYMIVDVSQWLVIGLLSDGRPVIASCQSSGVGGVRTIELDGTLGTLVTVFSTGALPSTAAHIKLSYNSSGDITISYRTDTSTTTFTTWSTKTAAQLTTAGFAIAQQRMGVLSGAIPARRIVEFKVKSSGLIVQVGLRDEITGITDLVSHIYPWYNKNGCLVGDSITAEGFAPASYPVGTYSDRIVNKLKLRTITKYGNSGYCYGSGGSGNGNSMAADSILTTIGEAAADLYVILLGTNDFGKGVALGDPTNIADTTASPDTSTVGGCRKMIKYLKDNRPDAQVVVCTPLPRTNEEVANDIGNKLVTYVDAIKSVAKFYNVPCCDLFTQCSFTSASANTMSRFFLDGLHPNILGYERMTDVQVQVIRTLKF
jgi:lysophospholipase L1-like esterase